ncbi:E3 ubiquitin-protein ligase TRIM68 isoform X3 [Urocitellus parryii]
MDLIALVEAIMEEVACPICMSFLKEPVSIDCGHTFCHSCLFGLWQVPAESENWDYTCPLCRAPIQLRNLRPNWQLASVAEKVRLLQLCPGMELKGDVCELHREEIKMFCKEDGLIMCEACSQSPEHEAHSVLPMKDVAWEYKWKLHKALEHLKNEQDEAWKLVVNEKKRTALWKGIQEVLNRSESWRLQQPEPVSLELKTDCRVLGLREILKTYAADVLLDPDTAYFRLIVSEDRKCVHYGDIQQELPDNPERFYRYNIVLGSQCISSGRHYWEVEVGDRSEWGLGVCTENVDRKEVVYLSPQYGFWVIRLRKGTEYRAGTDNYLLLSLPVPPRRVGVFLDYEAHDISFYNVTDNGSHIFTFPPHPFPGRLLPYFSPCYSICANNTAPLTICSLDGED